MLVKKAKVILIEAHRQWIPHWCDASSCSRLCIVSHRMIGSGSAWAEYKKSGTMHGIRLREGMVESEKLDEPVVTPSTKAEQGAHDENISPEKGIWASLTVYCRNVAHAHFSCSTYW